MPRFDYLSPNALALRQRRADQLKAFCIALLVLCALWWDSPLPWLGAVFVLYVATGDPRRAAGAEGERRVLGQIDPMPGSLGTLPPTYTVFNNLLIPHRGRLCELDLIVVGPQAVFVVEVNHYEGRLTGDPDDAVWQQTKRHETKTVPNPLTQLARQVAALTTLLRGQGYDGVVQGLVVVTHPTVELALTSSRAPIVHLEALADEIMCTRPRRMPRAPGLPTVVLKEIHMAMQTPSGLFKTFKRYYADLTGRRPWMREFRPAPLPRYFMRDQRRTRNELLSDK